MRKVEVIVFNKGGVGSLSTEVEFESVSDFMSKVDELVESTDFAKPRLDFDVAGFEGGELDLLKVHNYLTVG